jgi:hypothetical protein
MRIFDTTSSGGKRYETPRAPVLALILALSCSTLGTPALRDLAKDREYPIVVRHIVDPRLRRFPKPSFRTCSTAARAYIREYLGYDVTFFVQANQPLLDFRNEIRRSMTCR